MGESCLKVTGLTKSYKGVRAVDHLSFEVNKGEIFGLIGTNGAGKSTTISMLVTLMKPEEGEVEFQGHDLLKEAKYCREKIGYVPQDIALYESLSGIDNLKFWGRAAHLHGDKLKERIAAVSAMIGFTEEHLKKKVQEYSGGMKRRLNIGVALLAEPELLILDEPTAGIDTQSRDLILNTIRELAETGMAVIYVGHYMGEIEKICDRILVLHRGKTVLTGALKDLLNTPEGIVSLEELYSGLNLTEA